MYPRPEKVAGFLSVLGDHRVLSEVGLTICVQSKPHIHFRTM